MKKQITSLLCLCLCLTLGACSAGGADGMNDYAPAEGGDTAAEAPWEYGEAEDNWMVDEAPLPAGDYSGETYLVIDENPAVETESESMLTFSLKVDTAAYSNVARYIESGVLPPRDAVRTEELINYFRYDTPLYFGGEPFAVHTQVGTSPLHADRHMAFIRVRTEDIDKADLPPSNLTFLIDTSGSMSSHDKLPLLQQSFRMLVETLDARDVVSIVTYAGSAGVALDSVPGSDRDRILDVIDSLTAGGSTAGEGGIDAAYALAEKNYMPGGNNRVILATDGDFNVGVSSVDALADLIAQKRDGGVYLSVLGFGTGNIREDIMETLSQNGNGNYAYIPSVATARKVLVEELGSNLFTVADDVKAQVEFNPATVKSYRLVGYENRRMSNRDFADDRKDAGEIGAGTDVVVLFELELHGGDGERRYTDAAPAFADELFEVRIRYKNPGEESSRELLYPVTFGDIATAPDTDFGFACSVAAFGELLRGSGYAGDLRIGDVAELAAANLGTDTGGYRAAHLELLDRYAGLAG